MAFTKRFRRASKTALYAGVGPGVAKATSTFAIVEGIGGGAPAESDEKTTG